MRLQEKIMSQPEPTRRRLALGASIVICLLVFMLWVGQTSRTISVTISEAQRVQREIEPNSPLRVLRNLGGAIGSIFKSAPQGALPEEVNAAAGSETIYPLQ